MADREHHRTKRRHYTVVLVPNEEASQSRSYRFAPWQVTALAVVGVVLVVTAFYGLLLWTPLSAWMSIPNPQLENRYGKEIVALNERMALMLEQLVELRTYNAMLRNALGDKSPSDSMTQALRARAEAGWTSSSPQTVRQAESRPVMATWTPISAPTRDALTTSAFPIMFPANGYVTRGFEPDKGHIGIDIAGKTGGSVLAAADGYVVFAGWTHLDGNIVIISHPGGFLTFYKHNQTVTRSAGVFVRRGEPIATLGSTGETSAGPHLHFEVWKDGAPRDPSTYFLSTNS